MAEEEFHPTIANAVLPGIVIGLTLAGIYTVPQYLLNVPPSLAENIYIATLLLVLGFLGAFIVYLRSERNLFEKKVVTS